jgi:UDP-glucose 4-epimerase
MSSSYWAPPSPWTATRRRAREQLGWSPRQSAIEELLAGMREATGMATPPLEPRAGGRLRIREFLTGIGRQT